MGIRSKRAIRCRVCRMHVDDCICALIPALNLETKVIVVMHHREWRKPTATAPLFALAAPNCEIRLRGRQGIPLDTTGIVDPERQSFLLYPGGNAKTLSRDLMNMDGRPVTLVVPDGNWRQAVKMAQRDPALKDLPRVVLPDMGPTQYLLRNEPKEGGLGTFEAIARALRILEGEDVYQSLNTLFTAMVTRTLATRGGVPKNE